MKAAPAIKSLLIGSFAASARNGGPPGWTAAGRDGDTSPVMFGSLDSLFAASVLFVGGHFLLSSASVRAALCRFWGTGCFQTLYMLVAGGGLLWMVTAYAGAPPRPLWAPPAALAWVPAALMLPACLLLAAGISTRSVTAMAGERFATGPGDPAPGVLRITRHPVLWAVALWAAGHLAVTGDLAGLIFFGGFLVLALGGMWHIDQRRQRSLGAAWGPIALTTSVLPFRAILARRTRFDGAGLGLLRPLSGLALYVALMWLHPWLFGVAAIPPA